jgi:hypothetical protein
MVGIRRLSRYPAGSLPGRRFLASVVFKGFRSLRFSAEGEGQKKFPAFSRVGRETGGGAARSFFQPTVPSAARRNIIPGVAPVWFVFSTTIVPLTSTVVRLPVGYRCGSA